jgi:hypothetical protein
MRRIPSTTIVLAIIYSLMLIVLFYGFFHTLTPNNRVQEIFQDGVLTDGETSYLKTLTCADVRKMLKTDENVCIFFRGEDGELVDLAGNGAYGVGCPGMEVDGKAVCVPAK